MSTANPPRVSVVMPAYNAGPFIGEVIATIIEQTYTDFELIILDDGSTDNTADVIKKYAQIDSRIQYHFQENQGSGKLGLTLNKAISLAQGEWIARADSDDTWFLDKLEKQMQFIDKNPDYILIGGGAEVTDERGIFLYNLYGPISDEDNRRSLTLYTTLAHGTVMFKKEVFDKVGGYQDIHAVEDLDLWQRMSEFGKIYNIPETLFRYRKNTSGISLSNQSVQIDNISKLGYDYFLKSQPGILNASTIRKKRSDIEALRNDYNAGVIDRLTFGILDDNRRIAGYYSKSGDRKKYLKQLAGVAFSGRAGFKLIAKSFFLKVTGFLRK